MPPLMKLPDYDYPRNALINFAPINDAIDGNRQNALMQRRQANEDTRLGMEQERLGMAKAESAEQSQMRKVQRWGAQAQVIDEMPDGPQKQALAGQFYNANPDLVKHAAGKGIDPQHPQFWKLLRAEAGNYDPLKQRQVEAQIAASRASSQREAELHPLSIELKRAQINQANQKDEMGGLITGMVRGALQPTQAQPQTGNPMLQKQSFGGEAQSDPNLILAQARNAQPTPQTGPRVGSMFDGKTPEEKRRIGEVMLLDPRTKAYGEQLIKDSGSDRVELGKPASNDIDEKIVAGLEQISRLEAMNQTFQDKYQTIGTRLGMAGTGWMAKIDPSKVDPKSAQELAAFAKDRRRGIENLNMTIKDITGAAMSLPEAARISQQVPNPGTGVFDGDDPISYRAKMQDALDQTRLAVARRAWLKKNNPQLLDQLAARKMEGVETVMPLDRMRDMMNQRKNEIYQGLKQKNPNASREQLLPYVGQMLNQEFGI